MDGVEVGSSEGAVDGNSEGPDDGKSEGLEVGNSDGLKVGRSDGNVVGLGVGDVIGILVSEFTKASQKSEPLKSRRSWRAFPSVDSLLCVRLFRNRNACSWATAIRFPPGCSVIITKGMVKNLIVTLSNMSSQFSTFTSQDVARSKIVTSNDPDELSSLYYINGLRTANASPSC